MGGSIHVERRQGDMDTAAVLAVLGRWFPGEDLSGFQEWEWKGERVHALWVIYRGARGISSVGCTLHDGDPRGLIEGWRRELPAVAEPLREIAKATGARLYVGEADLTKASMTRVIDELGGFDTPALNHRRTLEDYPDETGDAARNLARWLAEREAALARLPPHEDPWAWAAPRLRFGTPAEAAAEAPLWYRFPSTWRGFPPHDWWTAESLDLLTAVLYRAGESVPGGRWESGHRYNHDLPVLIAGEKLMDPRLLARDLINALLSGQASAYDLRTGEREKPLPPNDFIAEYREPAGERIGSLRERSGLALGYDPGSLVALWAWTMGELRRRPDRDLIDLARIPACWRYGSGPPWGWSDDSLGLIDAVAHYLAECVLRAVPDLHWELDPLPVLTGAGHRLDPVMTITALASPVHARLREDPDDRREAAPDDLLKVYREMLAPKPFSLPSKSS